MTEKPSLPYDEVTDEQYAVRAAAEFIAERDDEDLVLFGTCPRCADPMRMSITSETVRRQASAQPYVVMFCLCATDHPLRPEYRDGCGAYWTLVVTDEPA